MSLGAHVPDLSVQADEEVVAGVAIELVCSEFGFRKWNMQ
jgi:hypothetical protein